MGPLNADLTQRQWREIVYHSERAELVRKTRRPVTYDVLSNPHRRWWNHYWCSYAHLIDRGLDGKAALVIGCGEGFDAIRLAKLGATVHAFDLSPDMLAVAEERAAEEHVQVHFREMAAERIGYADNSFDIVFVCDVLHHCDLKQCVPEIVRVARPGAFVLIDELYTHRFLQLTRESRFGNWLHRRLVPILYSNAIADTYITEDERKLNESDLSAVLDLFKNGTCTFYSMVVNRFLPSWDFAAKLDRILLKLLGPAGYFFAGRFIVSGLVQK